MYSSKLKSVFLKLKIKPGKRIRIEKEGKVYEGLLMPKTEFSNPDVITIKLDSGYNIGILYSSDVKISRSKRQEPESVKEESDYEMGRIDKKLVDIKFDRKKPPISIVSTGGTIASRVDYRTGAVTAASTPKEILHNIPELVDIVNIKYMDTPFNKMSEDMDSDEWIKLARVVAKNLKKNDVKGVIITHGTDTMHFTSAALSFFLKNPSKPVIFVGAQRSSDRGSSDAGMNIICAAHAAVSDIAEVSVCMHGEMSDSYCLLNRGTKVRKMHTSRRDAFRPINEPPLARVWPSGKIEKLNTNIRKRNEGKLSIDAVFEKRVAILKAYPGSEPEVIDFYVSKGFRGFVIEATGLGHVPTLAKKSWVKTIKKHIKDGIPFVTTPQTIYGRINPDVYSNLRILHRESGAIPGEDMLPETAYVKLGYVLAKTGDIDEVRRLMRTNIAGEITERSVPEGFLY